MSGKRKERTALIDWIGNHIGHEEYTLIFENKSSYKLSFEGSFEKDDKPKKTKWLKNNEKPPAFILTAKGREKDIGFFPNGHWRCVGNGFFFSLYENAKRFKIFALPLRFNLSKEEKVEALRIARSILETFLREDKLLDPNDFKNLPRRFLFRTDLDASIWIEGRMRGSWIVEGKSLIEGLIEGIAGAARDPRFKPLSGEELNDSRIEITLMSDIRSPLSKSVVRKNELLEEKGFRLKMGDKTGWFLPEVYNVHCFQNLSEFLGDLSQKKAGLTRNAWQNKEAFIETFEVEDFIEDAERQKACNLYGPIIAPLEVHIAGDLERAMKSTADWLINIQERDGNFPPIINPLTGRQTQIDWPRSAFTGWALAEFCEMSAEERYIKAVRKHNDYLKKWLDKITFPSIENTLLTYAYAGQEALALYRSTHLGDYYLIAKDYSEKIISNNHKLNFEPVTFQQIAGFLLNLAVFENRFLKEGLKFAQVSKENFDSDLKNKKSLNLAVWAESVNIFLKIYKFTNDVRYLEYSKKVADWLLSHQLESGPGKIFGPFPATSGSQFVYTRGTGKIFEVLSQFPEFKEKMERTIAWLLSMQYTEGNAFFISEEIKRKIIGGFRHDYFNQEVWIDSAGHFILGGARFLKQGKSSN